MISSIAAQRTGEDSSPPPISFQVGDNETAANNLLLSAASSNLTLVPEENMVFGGSGSNRTVAITPAANQFGSGQITLTVSDGSLIASSTFTFGVDPINDAPTVSAIANQTVARNDTTGPIPFTVTDIDNAPSSLSVTASSSDQLLLPDARLVLGGNGTNRTITATPATNQTGTASVVIAVADGVDMASTTFTTIVRPGTYLALEAESASLVAPMSIILNSQASNGRYIASTRTDRGEAAFNIQTPLSDTYVVWCRVLAPASNRDTFYLSADGGPRDVFDIFPRSSSWQWIRANGRGGTGEPRTLDPRTFSFTEGTHSVVFGGRERWTGLDCIIVSNDRSFVPTNGFMQSSPPMAPDENLRIAITSSNNVLTLAWQAAEQQVFQPIYKEDSNDPDWILFPETINPTSNTATWAVSPSELGAQFLRILRLQ
jgi:hypothetical protein